MIQGIIAFALIGISLAANSANQYVDNVLQTAYVSEIRARRADSLPVPNFRVDFGTSSYRTLRQANFTGGNVTGFINLRRKSSCQGPKYVAGQISINCTLSLYPLTTSYNVRVKNGSAVYNARVMGRVNEILIPVQIVGQTVGSIQKYDLTNVVVADPTFYGLPNYFNQYLRLLSNDYRNTVYQSLYTLIYQNVISALVRALQTRPMPRN